jgi:ribonucleoside-diphosphate reductase alpha chain
VRSDVTASVMGPAARAVSPHKSGLSITRMFTKPGVDPLSEIAWSKRRSEIKSPDGSKIIFAMDDVEAPEDWSQVAVDIAADKYFRKAGVPSRGHEHSVRQLVNRVAKAIRASGEKQGGYFASADDAQAFEDELVYMLATQRGAFNSPVFFNAGVYEAYGMKGSACGLWAYDLEKGTTFETSNSYERPQCSACFIQSIEDDLMDIADFVKREMRLFKGGSGSGANFSTLRAETEPLSSGGTSSGLMSYLEVFDKGAGAIKSGGTTRRAAKMVILNADHPDIETFIEWKAREEDKVLALMKAGFSKDEAYRTVSGQNANNSVRVTDEFMRAVIEGKPWETRWRTNGKVAKTLDAKKLFRKIAEMSWKCADPGMQFDTTINKWHTVPKSGRINGSNPCSEYMSLDDSACNLASLNLMKFLRRVEIMGRVAYKFDVAAYRHAARIFTLAQEILVDYAAYPTQKIAQNTHDFRQLGLGYANLGAMLMVMGIPYDSKQSLGITSAVTAILTGTGYATSAEISASKGPFPGFELNREPMLGVMRAHRDCAYRIEDERIATELTAAARAVWDDAIEAGESWGYRNAQATVLAPTGTIGLMMDCDTTGIEPDFALVKSKKLAGGGFMSIPNRSVALALEALGYTADEIQAITRWIVGTRTLDGPQPINKAMLAVKNLSADEVATIEASLPTAGNMERAFAAAKREDIYKTFTDDEIAESSDVIFGRGTIEGAPSIKPEHLPVFDCASKSGKGTRFIAPMGHVRMLEAAQPFVSGSISKTVNCPNETTVDEIEQLHMEAWKRGLKCIAIYRDGSKHVQVLSTGDGKKKDADKTKAAEPTKDVAKPFKDDRSGQAPPPTRRHRLPKKRALGFTQEISVAGQKLYLRTGEYLDGSLGEIFIDMHKDGALLRSLMNAFAVAISLGLQHGVPLQEYVEAFTFTKFEPNGVCDHEFVKMATSILDAVFRVLALEYLGEDGLEYVQKKPTEKQLAERKIRRVLQQTANAANLSDLDMVALVSKLTGVTVAPVPTNGNGHTNGNGDTKTYKRSLAEGQACSRCGNLTVRTGTCSACTACGLTTGCS